jgi:hypothetical protein
LKSAEPRQLAFAFADSPKGDKTSNSRDESNGRQFLVHKAKGSGRTETATGATAPGRLMEKVASASNLAQALLNVLRNKGAPGVDGRSVEQVADERRLYCPSCKTLFWRERTGRMISGEYGYPKREGASEAWVFRM